MAVIALASHSAPWRHASALPSLAVAPLLLRPPLPCKGRALAAIKPCHMWCCPAVGLRSGLKGEGETRICPCQAPARLWALRRAVLSLTIAFTTISPVRGRSTTHLPHRIDSTGVAAARQPPSQPHTMATACVAAPAVARPTMAVSGARKSAFFAGSAAMAAPRAATGALASARRQPAVIEARASKASTAGQQITVDVDKPLGLVGARGGQRLQCV